MRRDDPREVTTPPQTLEEALRVPDLEDGEVVGSLWEDLVIEATAVEAPVATPPPVDGPAAQPWAPPLAPDTPAPGPAVDPAPDTPAPDEPYVDPEPISRREARRRHREAKDQARIAKLAKRRHRILPRTVIGISTMLLFFGLGVGVAGAALYAYYDWRLSENEQRVGELSESLEARLQEANGNLEQTAENQIQALRREAAGLRQLVADQAVVSDLTPRLRGSVWFVETLDENGSAAVGSAFVAASDDSQSLLVTSYSVVAAGTTEPSPTITLRSGDETVEADLYNWDPANDLALLTMPRGGLEPLTWAGDRYLSRIVGKHVWAAEGIGGNGVSLSPGQVIDQSDLGIQHTAALNSAFRGGPIVNGRGEVVAIASTAYAPLHYPGGDVSFGVPVQSACERVLNCSGEVPGLG